MIFKRFVVGPLEVNCYIIADEETKEGFIVDPGDNGSELYEFIKSSGINLKYIINTHCHFDHIGANKILKEKTGAKLAIHIAEKPLLERAETGAKLWGFNIDASPEPDVYLNDGDILKVGNIDVLVIHTPGHSPGGICLKIDDIIITGDTLFAGGIGRTDFPGGSFDEIIKSIKEKLFIYPKDTKIYPGHGPASTIENEKIYNPFF
ncbi:MAG: MBL fold metallo-hydrolase [Proteobacteria bacterium]|nr:MBL fold metallo-hydrolase [Pseudomonadota bacterium]